jgi:hypothetical protein
VLTEAFFNQLAVIFGRIQPLFCPVFIFFIQVMAPANRVPAFLAVFLLALFAFYPFLCW